ALEVIFGVSAGELFPGIRQAVNADVEKRLEEFAGLLKAKARKTMPTRRRASWRGFRGGWHQPLAMNLDTKRVLALDLRPRSFGFVIFENAELLDWGVKIFRNLAGRMIPAGHKLAPLLSEFQPSVVLL